MAVIQYTGIVNQIRGKLNGSVFNRARNANTLQRKQQAPRRDVGRSSGVRNVFSQAQRSWKTLGTADKERWALAAANNPSRDRFGNLVPLSGYNQYIKAFMFATYAGQTPPTTPDTSPAPAPGVDGEAFQNYSFDQQPDGSVVVNYAESIDFTNMSPGFALIFDLSMATSPGVTVYYGRFVHIAGGTGIGSITLSGSTNIGTRYAIPTGGQTTTARYRLVYLPNGSVVFEERLRSTHV